MNAVQNTLLSYVNSITVQVIVLAGVIVLARILDPEDYGIWAIVAATQAMMQPFFTMGLRPAFIKREKVTDEHRNIFFTTNVGVSFGIAIIFALAGIIFSIIFDRQIYIGIGGLQAIAALFFGFTLQRFDSLYREKDFLGVLKIKTTATIISLLAGIGLALAGFGVWALAVKLFLENFIQFIVARKVHTFKYKLVGLKQIKTIEKDIRFGLQLTAGRLMNGVAGSLDKYMVSGMTSTEILGQYDRSFMLSSRAYQASYIPFNAVILPYIARVKKEKLAETYDFVFFATLIFSIVPSLLFLVNAKSLVLLLFGPKWEMASYFAPFLGIWLIGKIFEGLTEMILTNEYKGSRIIKQKVVYITVLFLGSATIYFFKREPQFYVLSFSCFSFSFWFMLFSIRIFYIRHNLGQMLRIMFKVVLLLLMVFFYYQQYDFYVLTNGLIVGILLKSLGLLLLMIPFFILFFKKDSLQLFYFIKSRIIK